MTILTSLASALKAPLQIRAPNICNEHDMYPVTELTECSNVLA